MTIIGGINLGSLTEYLFFFADARNDANWQGATKGYVGDVAIDGIQADERTSGSVPYGGTIYTNDSTLGAWQNIINQNPTQAGAVFNETSRINALQADLISAFQQINALPATTGYESVSSTSLNGLNTQNGVNEVFVINITSGLSFSSKINITGDPGDVFILRWDSQPGTPGYQGQVKPSSGGAIVPLGGLKPTNFINVAGDINASGGGTTPMPPYPQGPRYNDGLGDLINGGSDFSGGGFFTGYWLTTGTPTTLDPGTGLYYGETSPLSNDIFVGGWYTITTKFSMTSGTSGVYVSPNPATTAQPAIDIEKYVSVDGGTAWVDADTPPGPHLLTGMNPKFKFLVTNTGNATLTNITLTDTDFGTITIPTTSLNPGNSFEVILTGTWAAGQHSNTATVNGVHNNINYSDSDPAHYYGTTASIDIKKYISTDGGVSWEDANFPPGPSLNTGTNPKFKFAVTNTGNSTLTNITLTDTVYGILSIPTTSLNPGEHFEVIITGTWAAGQHSNTATVSGVYNNVTYTDSDPAHYFGATAPSIDIEKYVSVDGGVTWHGADSPPGPYLPPGASPQFKFVVTNTGNAPLTDISVTDTFFGPVGTLESLAPGDSYEWVITG